jgi:hypothetical protein
VRPFLHYLLGKKSELEDFEWKDALSAKGTLEIHRKRTPKDVVMVPLLLLLPVHAIDRENAIQATGKRADRLREHAAEIVKHGELTRASLARSLPSVSWIKVVQESPMVNLCFEGNGRIAALPEVFTPEHHLMVEVERYPFEAKVKVLRRLNRVRRRSGLLD